jgi:hypothetical protein
LLPYATLQGFAASGTCIFTLKSDSSNPQASMAALAWVHEYLPQAKQYVHAAGKSGFTLLEDLHETEFWDVAKPKVTK